jgi:hypothetical protein
MYKNQTLNKLGTSNGLSEVLFKWCRGAGISLFFRDLLI